MREQSIESAGPVEPKIGREGDGGRSESRDETVDPIALVRPGDRDAFGPQHDPDLSGFPWRP